MNALGKFVLASLCLLSAGGSLLATISAAICWRACGSHLTARTATDVQKPSCAKPCCEGKAHASVCSCCVPLPVKQQPGDPRTTCASCPCAMSTDGIPPTAPAPAQPLTSGMVALAVLGFDLPADNAAASRAQLMHHPPPQIDLVISLSRLTC
jgi:hypothetical protein